MDDAQERGARQCDLCDRPATWARRTHVGTTHCFCTRHAQSVVGVDLDKPSYLRWERLPPQDSEGEARERVAS
jgi:hypothetical protein